ncbi:MAG: endonuclease Q family protein [Patescibacteria group bacterium]|jgi:DNA helicase-2/ATP-dependent DNA helicase PcrA
MSSTRLIIDFHVHSRFARACSKTLTLPNMAAWAAVKGIDVLGTADFTHPVWLKEIQAQLVEAGQGVYTLKAKHGVSLPYDVVAPRPVRFLLTHEVATIWSQGGKLRRMHTVLVAPDMRAAEALTEQLTPRGKLGADGRPILGMSARELAVIAWGVDERYLVIPAHAWTPWFAVFGSQSGFDSLEECFGDLTPRILAVETGLSSDPTMNWQLSALDSVALISTSDAHSPDNLGREATVFQTEDELSFDLVAAMLRAGAPARSAERSTWNYLDYTIEFFPEEGKYHNDGHRTCGVSWTPEERKRHNGLCTSCGKPVTVGVLSRIDDLADRPHGFVPDGAPGYRNIVPIRDIASSTLGVGKKAKAVDKLYEQLVTKVGPEFDVLLDAELEAIRRASSDEFAEIVGAMRQGQVSVRPGYDGVYGELLLPDRNRSRQANLFQQS